MVENEYEILYIKGGVSVRAIAYVDLGEVMNGESLEHIAIRRALLNINSELGTNFTDDDFEEINIELTGSLRGY